MLSGSWPQAEGSPASGLSCRCLSALASSLWVAGRRGRVPLHQAPGSASADRFLPGPFATRLDEGQREIRGRFRFLILLRMPCKAAWSTMSPVSTASPPRQFVIVIGSNYFAQAGPSWPSSHIA